MSCNATKAQMLETIETVLGSDFQLFLDYNGYYIGLFGIMSKLKQSNKEGLLLIYYQSIESKYFIPEEF